MRFKLYIVVDYHQHKTETVRQNKTAQQRLIEVQRQAMCCTKPHVHVFGSST